MDTPSSIIEELKQNNDVPSDTTIKELNDMLRKPLQNLDRLDAQIQSLEQCLAELKNKRTQAQEWVAPYQFILSQMRRLPMDILTEIFHHCLSPNRNPIIKTTECPMLLTHVCSRWRTVAIADTRLWSHLYVTFSDDDLIPVGDADGINLHSWSTTLLESSKQRAIFMLRNRIDAVKEWFLRSGTRPLSISLKVTCNLSQTNLHSNHDSTNDMTLEFFQYLASISPRFEDLEINMSIDMYRFLENMLVIPNMQTLKSFRADFHTSSLFNRQDSWGVPIGLLSAPSLQRISMSGESVSLWKTAEETQSWRRLTHLACYQSLSVYELAYFLERSPNLLFFKAMIGRDSTESDLTQTHSFKKPIHLPFLRTLHVTEHIHTAITGKLYNSIDAPCLHWVSLMARFPIHHSTASPPPIPIEPLLFKSKELKKLTLAAHDIVSWGVNGLLRVVPSLTHLVIGTDPRPSITSLSRSEAALMSYRTINSSWDLGGLLVGRQSDVENDPPLLPNLESLDVSIRNGYFSDRKLKDFVISRLAPSSRGITSLKHVGVNFFREKEMDVEKDIRDHAKLVGSNIELELNYPDSLHNPQPRTFSPAYGLHIHDGRSWAPRGYDSLDF